VRRVIAGALTAAAVVLLAALAVGYRGLGDAGPSAAGMIVLADTGIQVPRAPLCAWRPVEVRNAGRVVHTPAFLGPRNTVRLALAPGRSRRVRAPSRPGLYRVVDRIRNHEQLGLVGYVRVEAARRRGGACRSASAAAPGR
jgi:hypothetical protein